MQADSQSNHPNTDLLEQSRHLSEQAWENRNDNRTLSRTQSLEALQLAGGDALARAFALRALAQVENLESNYIAALDAAEEALQTAKNADQLLLQRDVLNTFGAIHYRLGDIDNALGYAEQTFQINVKLRDEPAIVYSLNNFALLHNEVGNRSAALLLFEDAVLRSRQIGNPSQQTLILNNLGECQTALGRPVEAIATLREALQLTENYELTNLEPQCLCNLAEALTAADRLDEALEVYAQALETVALHGPPEGEFHCQLGQANVHLMRQQPSNAMHNAENALRTAERLGGLELKVQAHSTLCKTFKAMGDFETALYHLEHHHQLAQQMRASVTEHRLQTVTAHFQINRARAETEIAHVRNVELAKALQDLERLNAEKTDLLKQLERKSFELEQLAFKDSLTGLPNRRQLETVLEFEVMKAQGQERPLSLALIDVDDFKRINDRFSHKVGDTVLIALSALIRDKLRAFDFAARYGGEEFVVILPRTSSLQALNVCERLRLVVAEYDWSAIQVGLKVTLSIGLSSNSSAESAERLLSEADDKMYEAKAAGKNCIRS